MTPNPLQDFAPDHFTPTDRTHCHFLVIVWSPDAFDITPSFISLHSTYLLSKHRLSLDVDGAGCTVCRRAKNEEGVLPMNTPAEGRRSFTRTSWSRRVRHQRLVLTAALAEDAALTGCFHSFAVSIISRAQWGAALPKKREVLKEAARKVVIHHTALPKCSGPSGCRDLLQSIQRSHMTDRNFDDIGYK